MSAPPLRPWVGFKPDGEVLCAHCNCMAGAGEACSHIAVFYTICVFYTVRVRYIPYAYGIMVYTIRIWYIPYAYGYTIRVSRRSLVKHCYNGTTRDPKEVKAVC